MNARHKWLYYIRDGVSDSQEKYGANQVAGVFICHQKVIQCLPFLLHYPPHPGGNIMLQQSHCPTQPTYPDNQSQPTPSAIQHYIHLPTLLLLECLTLDGGTNRWS
jgi:hypothetical protein